MGIAIARLFPASCDLTFCTRDQSSFLADSARYHCGMSFFGFGSGGGFGQPFPGHPFGAGFGQFRERYRCFSMVFSTKTSEEITHGGKIIMPPSALEKLSRLNISYPMLFKLSNGAQDKHTHCGVLEFVAEEGRIYVPHWMINQLYIQDGDIVEVKNATLKLATFSKFQPQTTDFLDITNPKAVLESKLRSFACLTKGDMIGIEYNKKIYELLVLETKPDDAVSIIECDMKVDFAAPVGYKPPEAEKMNTDAEDGIDAERDELIKEALEKNRKFQAFSGGGQRLDGKVKGKPKGSTGSTSSQLQTQQGSLSRQQAPTSTAAEVPARGIPNYDYKKGKLTFARAKDLNTNPEEPMDESQSSFTAFGGEGQRLRVKRNKNKDSRR